MGHYELPPCPPFLERRWMTTKSKLEIRWASQSDLGVKPWG